VNVVINIYPPFQLGYSVIASPSWSTDVQVTQNNNGQFELIFSVPAPANATVDWVATPALDTSAGQVFVTPGATTGTINVPSGQTGNLCFVCPNWNTNVWITSRTSSQVNLAFSTPAPNNNALAFLFEPSSRTGTLAVTGGAASLSTSITGSGLYQVFVVPNWNTEVTVNKSGSTIAFEFSNPAPSAGGSLNYAIHGSFST
jgi:hypothetical protein